MHNFTIYDFSFFDATFEGNFLDGNQVVRPDGSESYRREMLEFLFGDKNTSFTVKKYNKYDADDYPCTVMAHYGHFVLLRLEHPKQVKIFKKQEPRQGEVASIDECQMPSTPFIYILIDCREGGSNKIAISIDTNAWRSTDKVSSLLADNINRALSASSRGFGIKIKPVLMSFDFVSHSRYLIKKQKLGVRKITFYFTRGLINPKVEEIVNNDRQIKSWLRGPYEFKHGEITLFGPDSERIIRANSNLLTHFVTLVASDPVTEPFRLSMSYSNGTTFSCGKDTRMEFSMDEATFIGILSCTGSLFPEQDIEGWFNMVEKEIKEQRNAANQEQDRKTKAVSSLRSDGLGASFAASV